MSFLLIYHFIANSSQTVHWREFNGRVPTSERPHFSRTIERHNFGRLKKATPNIQKAQLRMYACLQTMEYLLYNEKRRGKLASVAKYQIYASNIDDKYA